VGVILGVRVWVREEVEREMEIGMVDRSSSKSNKEQAFTGGYGLLEGDELIG